MSTFLYRKKEEKPKDTLNSVAWMEGAMAILEPKKQTLQTAHVNSGWNTVIIEGDELTYGHERPRQLMQESFAMFHFSWRGGQEITVSLLMWAQYHVLNKPARLHEEHFQSCYSKKVTEDGRRPNFVF